MVSDKLEKITYTRIKKPPTATVLDDTFVRTRGGLNRDWNEGCSIGVMQLMIREKLYEGKVLVGWELQSDLTALGFRDAGRAAADGRREGLKFGPLYAGGTEVRGDICELTDYYRTAGEGDKCRLSEAYREIFGRELQAHDAGEDAAMTMQLYNHWLSKKTPHCPFPRIPIRLSWFVVKAHRFNPQQDQKAYQFDFLRPLSLDSVKEIVNYVENRKYELRFRSEAEKDAYLQKVKRALATAHPPQTMGGPTIVVEPYPAVTYSCGNPRMFELYTYKKER
jgi:hypothetical protein